MPKFTKPFLGVPKGEIYPVQYDVGDECPVELEAGAVELDALEAEEVAIEDMTASQIKAALTEKGVEFKASDNKDELISLLQGAGE
jgi:hypothetical protein